MRNAEKGPHPPHTVTAEILPVESGEAEIEFGILGNKTVMAPVVDGIHDSYTQNQLYHTNFAQYWDRYSERDIWVWINTDKTRALRLVIEPVSKDDAHHIRAQYRKVWQEVKALPQPDDVWSRLDIQLDDGLAATLQQVVQGIADRIADTKPEQQYRQSFLHALVFLPDQFAHVDGQLVELEGLNRGHMKGLKPADVALLKRVWRRLPLKYQSSRRPLPMKANAELAPEERCARCGGPKRQRPKYTKRAKLRKALAEFHKEYPQEVFNEWIKARLRFRPGDFTYTRELYADYVACVQKGTIIVGERPVMRDTVLSRDKWGRLMGARFEKVKRNGRIGYKPVALKGTRLRT